MRDNTPRPSDVSVPTGAAAVGQMLREARESLGLDLAQVAEDTRIRLPFLEAIEEGRFQDLPGSAYAPAFLRGYAGCVGLDVDRVMEVYRSGDKPAVPAAELHFPVVPIERRTPRGALLLASVALLIGAYVTWHAMTRGQMTQDARVPPVPQRLLADQKPTPSGEPASPPPPVAQPTAGAPQPAPTEAPAATLPAPPSTTAGTSPVQPPQATPPAAANTAPGPAIDPSVTAGGGQPPRAGRDGRPAPTDVTRGTGGDVKPEPNPQVAGPPAPVSPPAPPVAARPPSGEPAPARKATGESVTAQDSDPTQPNRVSSRTTPPPRPPAPPPSTAGADAAPPQQAAVPPETAKPAAKPRTQSGPPSTRARTVRAEVDSTLELRGPGGEVLATTYLRAGSTYTVPEHVGYALIPGAR
jgi:cytoskeleton protein RodZ